MIKQREMNQEKIRIRFVEVYEEYSNPKTSALALPKMKEIVKEYDDIIDILDETLNCAIGMMDAITKKEIKDKKEEEQFVKEMLKELKEKSYLSIADIKEEA